jgi:hypothetical protein
MWAGKPGRFVFDTGAGVTMLDAGTFPDLKATDEAADVSAISGHMNLRYYWPPALKVGPFALNRCGPVVCIDLSDARALTGEPIIGILGVSAFDACVAQIDVDAGKLRLLPSDFREHPEWGTPLPLRLDDTLRTPVVRLNVEGHEGEYNIDTGNQESLSLTADVFDAIARAKALKVVSLPYWDATGQHAEECARSPHLDIAGMRHRELVIDRASGSTGSTGILGLGFLERYVVTIDLPGHRLYLKPGRQFDRQENRNMSGLRIARKDGSLVVHTVLPSSPGGEAGVREGDVVVELDGKPVESLSVRTFVQLFESAEGREVSLTLQRGDRRLSVNFRLRRQV